MELKPTTTLATICALSALSRRDMYEEQLCREVESVLGANPEGEAEMLSKLRSEGFVETYDWPADGESRCFFRLTGLGQCLLEQGSAEWKLYKQRVDLFLERQARAREEAVSADTLQ